VVEGEVAKIKEIRIVGNQAFSESPCATCSTWTPVAG
jgi:outer membrane protein assembly factor BamA